MTRLRRCHRRRGPQQFDAESLQPLAVGLRAGCLQGQQLGVDTSGGGQLGRGADLVDATGVQGDDPVDAGDRREAVGDDEAGAVGHEGFQTGLHPPLGLGVQG